MPIELALSAPLVGNLGDVRERFVAVPNVAGFDVGHHGVGAGEAGVVEAVGAEERVEVVRRR